MRLSSVIVLACAIGAVASEKQQECSQDSDPLCWDRTNTRAFKEISRWWDSLAAGGMKPVKCRDRVDQGPPIAELRENKKAVFFKSCEESQASKNIRLVGFKLEKGQILGSGKATVLDKYMVGDDTVYNLCLGRLRFVNNDITSFVGTMVNSSLQGIAKLTLGNNDTVIGRFHNSVPHGFFRTFNASGALVRAGYFNNGVPAGYMWSKLSDDTLVYSYEGRIWTPKEKETSLFMTQQGEFWSGVLETHIKVLDHVHDALVHAVNAVGLENDCSLEGLDWSTGEARDFRFDTDYCEKFPVAYSPPKFCDNDQLDPHQRLFVLVDHTYFSEFQCKVMYKLRDYDEPLDTSEAKYLVQDLKLVNASTDNHSGFILGKYSNEISIRYPMYDEQDRLHGVNIIFLPGTKDAFNVNPLLPPTKLAPVLGLAGRFEHGVLQGIALIYIEGNRGAYGRVKDGILHGQMIVGGQRPILPLREGYGPETRLNRMGLAFFGHFRNGHLSGHYLVGMYGNSFLFNYQQPGEPEELTSNNMTYVYYDMQTALKGRFENGVMKAAKEVEVLDAGCDPYDVPILTKVTEPKEDGTVFYFEPPTNESFAGGPYGVRDPFEARWVDLRMSNTMDSGEGVFLKKRPLGRMPVALYTGLHYNKPEQVMLHQERYCANTTLSDDRRRHCKKYTLGTSYNDVWIDIPWEFDQPGVFHPSLGPKVNHDFYRNNSAYVEVENPRWGLIQSVHVMEDAAETLKPGDELFTFYGYKKGTDFPSDFPWYWELKEQIDAERKAQGLYIKETLYVPGKEPVEEKPAKKKPKNKGKKGKKGKV